MVATKSNWPVDSLGVEAVPTKLNYILRVLKKEEEQNRVQRKKKTIYLEIIKQATNIFCCNNHGQQCTQRHK